MKIFILCDGTWLSETSTKVSHIYRLYTYLNNIPDCKVVYQSGVGTCSQLDNQTNCVFTNTVTNIINGGLALDIDEKIQTLYKKLINIYEDGDTIHLIGYSRGAYTVRCLAGLIYNCGLPNKHQLSLSDCLEQHHTLLQGKNKIIKLDDFVQYAYLKYRSRDPINHPHTLESIAFRDEWSTVVETPIEYLFCFDTVGTLGIPPLPFVNLSSRYRFFDTTVNKNVKNAIHFLAQDEYKVVFQPTLMNSRSNVRQYIVSGVHSTVGGLDTLNLNLSYKPLIYLMSVLNMPDLFKIEVNKDFKFIPPRKTFFDYMCYFIGGYKKRNLKDLKYLSDM